MLSAEVRRGQQVLVHETMSSTTKQHKKEGKGTVPEHSKRATDTYT